MQRTSLKRAAAAVTVMALSAVGSVALAPAASAAPTEVASISSASKPVILNAAGQTAGDITVTTDEAAANGDTIDIRVAPSSTDCASADEAPKAISWADGIEDDNTNVTLSTLSDCVGGSLKNVLRLSFTGAVPSGTAIKLTKVKLNAGETTPTGDVRLKVTTNAAPVFQAGNATVNAVDRTFGPTRFDTAVALAKQYNTDGCADQVVVVNGTNFPDALSSAYLGLPILMVNTNLPLPAVTADALEDLGVGSVIAVGGTGVISSEVLTNIANRDEATCGADVGAGKIGITRRSGANRFATSVDVATHGTGAGTFDTNTTTAACDGPQKTVIVVNGNNFPDALAAGALSASTNRGCGTGRIPILLTEPNVLRAELPEAFSQLNPSNVVIVGGTAAVSDAVKNQIDELPGVLTVNRVFGATRQATAVELSKVLLAATQGGFEGKRLLLNNGHNFPDALAAGPLAAQEEWPILLSESPTALGTVAAAQIKAVTSAVRVTLLGGTGALSDGVKTAVGNAILSRNTP